MHDRVPKEASWCAGLSPCPSSGDCREARGTTVLRAEPDRADGNGAVGAARVGAVRGLPNLEGDIDEMIDVRPVFRARMHGYDRLEVDNYTAWAERELLAAWRQADHLLSRFGECSVELELSRRLLAEAARGRDPFPISDRLQEMLRLAADEAAAITEAGRRRPTAWSRRRGPRPTRRCARRTRS